MIKRTAISLIGVFGAMAAFSASPSPVDKFIIDKEFCAYMASLPENESERFLARYQAAMGAAVSFIRQQDQRTTETQAIFAIKAKCDVALRKSIHYK